MTDDPYITARALAHEFSTNPNQVWRFLNRNGISPAKKVGRTDYYDRTTARAVMQYWQPAGKKYRMPEKIKKMIRDGEPVNEILAQIPACIRAQARKWMAADSNPDEEKYISYTDAKNLIAGLGGKDFLKRNCRAALYLGSHHRAYFLRDDVLDLYCSRYLSPAPEQKYRPLFSTRPNIDETELENQRDIRSICERAEKNPTPQNVWSAIIAVAKLSANMLTELPSTMSREEIKNDVIVRLCEAYRDYSPQRGSLWTYLFGRAKHAISSVATEYQQRDRVRCEANFGETFSLTQFRACV